MTEETYVQAFECFKHLQNSHQDLFSRLSDRIYNIEDLLYLLESSVLYFLVTYNGNIHYVTFLYFIPSLIVSGQEYEYSDIFIQPTEIHMKLTFYQFCRSFIKTYLFSCVWFSGKYLVLHLAPIIPEDKKILVIVSCNFFHLW